MVYSTAERVAEPLEERARARARDGAAGARRQAAGGRARRASTLGRSRQCDVVLDDPNVSRQHAEIRPRGGSWVLTDLGSTNGIDA